MTYSGRIFLLFVKDHIPGAKYGLTKAIFDEVGKREALDEGGTDHG
jgi:hypothetical protein